MCNGLVAQQKLSRLLFVQPVHKGENLGDGLIEGFGDGDIKIEFGEDGHEVGVFVNVDAVRFGHGDDLFGD
mgnify:CR=1 FL=1